MIARKQTDCTLPLNDPTPSEKGFKQALDKVVLHNEEKLAERLKFEILQEYQRYELTETQGSNR
jgi:hypothetical protein